MNHICPTVNGLTDSSYVLLSQLRERQELFSQCRLAIEKGCDGVSKLVRAKYQERLENAKECIERLEEQIEFNTALANMVLDAEENT